MAVKIQFKQNRKSFNFLSSFFIKKNLNYNRARAYTLKSCYEASYFMLLSSHTFPCQFSNEKKSGKGSFQGIDNIIQIHLYMNKNNTKNDIVCEFVKPQK